ncbi:MAG: hypothetical protein HN350_07155 [Phycisphaerales bacterium]|jgi:hypothetical protein|nr:hypothetical protein [Phycisphaerales bacterium]
MKRKIRVIHLRGIVLDGIILVMLWSLFAFVVGCGGQSINEHTGDRATKDYEATPLPKTFHNWVEYMQKEYAEGGIERFQKARMLLKKNRHLYVGKSHYDDMAMVFRLGTTSITEKEVELTAELRNLAISIEANPGESGKEWVKLRHKLYDYWFGNGGIDPESLVVRIVSLYSLIARGDPDIFTPEERSDKTPHGKMRANLLFPRDCPGQMVRLDSITTMCNRRLRRR